MRKRLTPLKAMVRRGKPWHPEFKTA